ATSMASATTFQLKGVVSNVFDASFAPVPGSPNGAGPYPPVITPSSNVGQMFLAGSKIYQVDLYESTSNVSAGARGFGNISWDMTLNSHLTQDTTLPGWQPDASNTDTNGSAPGGSASIWFANADGGTVGDLKNLLATITSIPTVTATDFRPFVGQQKA